MRSLPSAGRPRATAVLAAAAVAAAVAWIAPPGDATWAARLPAPADVRAPDALRGQIVIHAAAGADAALADLHRRVGARVVRRIPALGVEVVRLDDAPADDRAAVDRGRLEGALRAYAASGRVARLALDRPVRVVGPPAARGEPGDPRAGATLARLPLVLRGSVRSRIAGAPAAWSPRTASAAGPLARPSDPRLGDQWLVDAIGLPAAWDAARGDGVVVAIVDTGVDCDHEDLAGRCVAGIDIVHRDDDPDDDNRHGTIEAGIAAAATANGVGIAGVGWGARIMPIKAMDALGQGTLSGIAEGVVWAADHGARVVNLSLGGPAGEAVLKDAVDYAHGRGAVVVAAAGNMGTPGVLYPAAYPEAIAVAATTRADTRAPFSNQGPELDVAAPGWQILTTDLGDAYGVFDGTSEATAVVSGLAALLLAQRPSRTPDEVALVLARTAVDLGPPGHDEHFGHGRVDAAAAVGAAVITPVPTSRPGPTAPPASPAPCRPRHVDVVAFPDTVGRGGFGCAGCDRLYGGGDRAAAALCGLTPIRVVVEAADGTRLAEATLAPGPDGAARARLSLCAPPPYRVTLAETASGCYVLCPTTPAEVDLDASRFAGFGRSATVVWSFGHCIP